VTINIILKSEQVLDFKKSFFVGRYVYISMIFLFSEGEVSHA
jgi:hypothetical protein